LKVTSCNTHSLDLYSFISLYQSDDQAQNDDVNDDAPGNCFSPKTQEDNRSKFSYDAEL